MSEPVVEEVDDLTQPAEDGELVHWMAPRPLSPAAAAGVGFTLGVVATVAVLALTNLLGPERIVEFRRRRI